MTLLEGEAIKRLKELPDESVHCVVTSPPYWNLRNYEGHPEQLGLEKTPSEYINKLVNILEEVRRVLRKDGVLWLVISDTFISSGRGHHTPKQRSNKGTEGIKDICVKPTEDLKPKDMAAVPWKVAIALQEKGWWLRSDVVEEVELYCPCGCGHVLEERIWRYSQDRDLIWRKINPMPSSATDRPTKNHEYIFLLSKSKNYFYDHYAVMEPVSESTVGRKPVDFGGEKGRNYTPSKEDPNYRGGKEQWGRTFDYTESCKYGRNKRSVWTTSLYGYKEAHFATYPPSLITPCVLAGTSARGCCPKCGAPWKRIVKKENPIICSWAPGSRKRHLESKGRHGATSAFNTDTIFESKAVGWEPTCGCGEDPIPCTVLDPFSGSGTTGEVALKHNRSYIGIDLVPEYIKLQKKRFAPIMGTCSEGKQETIPEDKDIFSTLT